MIVTLATASGSSHDTPHIVQDWEIDWNYGYAYCGALVEILYNKAGATLVCRTCKQVWQDEN